MPTVWPAALLLATETAQCSHTWLLLKKGPTRLDDCALPAWPPARRGTELLWRPWTTSLTKEAQPIRSLAKGYMARILLAFKESYNFYEKEPQMASWVLYTTDHSGLQKQNKTKLPGGNVLQASGPPGKGKRVGTSTGGEKSHQAEQVFLHRSCAEECGRQLQFWSMLPLRTYSSQCISLKGHEKILYPASLNICASPASP